MTVQFLVGVLTPEFNRGNRKNPMTIDPSVKKLVNLWKAAEVKPNWMDDQCTAVFNSITHLSLADRMMVIEQVLDYLRQEEACDSAELKEE